MAKIGEKINTNTQAYSVFIIINIIIIRNEVHRIGYLAMYSVQKYACIKYMYKHIQIYTNRARVQTKYIETAHCVHKRDMLAIRMAAVVFVSTFRLAL